MKRIYVLILLSIVSVTLFAEGESATAESMDMVWLVVSAVLVFFMQAGFALLESGLTRAKNASNIIMKNMVDFAAGAVVYFLIGWALMYGDSVNGLFGSSQFALVPSEAGGDMSATLRDWFFQVVFAAAAATIVSGALAERARYGSYVLFSIIMTGLIYPVSGHWTWGGGIIAEMGFHDFAGSMIVHGVGGVAAFVGAWVIGPRSGRYLRNDDNKVRQIRAFPGHNMTLAALGVFILWFGWYGFNAGSTLSGNDLSIAHIAVTTTLSAASGLLGALFLSWIWFGKSDPSMTMNGALAGLVGITAGCFVISPGMAILVGLVSGILVVLSVEFFDKVLHVDDPVGASSVHGTCGIWGTLAVGLFGDLEKIGTGLTRAEQISVQLSGVLIILVWVAVVSLIVFGILKALKVLRVSREDELMGLDLSEHGTDSYSGFQIFSNM